MIAVKRKWAPLPPKDTSVVPPSAVAPSEPKQSAGKFKADNRLLEMNYIIDNTSYELDVYEKMIWLKLFRDARGGVVTTVHDEIHKRCNISLGKISDALKVLEGHGRVTRLHEGKPDFKGVPATMSVYRVLGVPESKRF